MMKTHASNIRPGDFLYTPNGVRKVKTVEGSGGTVWFTYVPSDDNGDTTPHAMSRDAVVERAGLSAATLRSRATR